MPVNSNKKNALFGKQDGKCFFCGQMLSLNNFVVDYNLPLSLIEDGNLDNIVLVCPYCNLNTAKVRPTESEFISFLLSLLNRNPSFKNVTIESFISPILRGDIVAEQLRNNAWHKIIIEVKSFATFTEKRSQEIIEQLLTYKKHLTEPASLIFAFPGKLPKAENELFEKAGIEVWDQEFILSKFKNEMNSFESPIFYFFNKAISKDKPKEQILIEGLDTILPGKKDWYKFQRHVEQILDYLFGRTLSPPITELSDKIEINRRDFILRNYCEIGFWKYIRERYFADFIVIDAKNYVTEIKKNDILQIANYLKVHGTGLFAIIITRKGESKSAYYIRRERWILDNKMIIILNDEDLKRMILAKAITSSPEELIKQKIEEFRLEI